MVDVKVCRICLVVDVPLYFLHRQPLESYFQTIMGENLLLSGLPPYACAICAAQINKYNLFRERCYRGQSLLYNMLNTEGNVSINSINQLNQECFLSIRSPEEEILFDFVHEDEVEVKHEPHDVDDPDDIKLETDFMDTMSQLSSDDEPLSQHSKMKSKKNKKVKQKNINKIEVEDFEDFEEITESKSSIDATLTPKRGRKRLNNKVPRPRRTQNTGGVELDDEDMEEYAIIKPLTLQEQLDDIEKRKTSTNYLNSQFQCNLCYKGYIDSLAWKHHIMKHDPSAGDNVCEICKFRFKTKRSLQKHTSTHDTQYQCKVCPFISKTATQAKQHHRWHKGVTYSCEHCSEVFTKWTSYLSHVRIKHPSEHICGVCGYSFVSQYGLNQHKSMMHKQEATPEQDPESLKPDNELYCSLCDIKFDNNEAWKRHVVMSAKHTNIDLPVGCRECGGWFSSNEELRAHHRREHPRPRPRAPAREPRPWPAPCHYCSEVIANAREYWAHFRRNHRDRQYPIKKDHVCDVCGKSFRGNAFLVYHKRTHTEERTYKCGQCPKAFFNRTNLQSHEKSHSDVRPYACSVCMKGFKSKGALDRHFRSHTGVKPYECEVCGKAFGQSNSRKLHVRTVHLKQPAPYVSKTRQRPKKETPVALACDFVYQ